MQELSSARDGLVMCGKCKMPWSKMEKGFAHLTGVIHGSKVASTQEDDFGMFWCMSALLKSLSMREPWKAKSVSFLFHLDHFHQCKVTNPLDRIYAFVGLPCRETVSCFKINHKCTEDRLWEVLNEWHILGTQTLDVLNFASPTTSTQVVSKVDTLMQRAYCRRGPSKPLVLMRTYRLQSTAHQLPNTQEVFSVIPAVTCKTVSPVLDSRLTRYES